VDTQGYLYLADSKSFMIISGGVNVYPQEAEDALSNYPAVLMRNACPQMRCVCGDGRF
ncbi:hypothetical protein LCGC14_2336610, partial [marine sediment metagenome]